MSNRIFILGAGYAGIEAALMLQKKKKKKDNFEIFIVDKNSYQTVYPLLHEVAGNRISAGNAAVQLKDVLKYSGIHIIKDEIVNIDFKGNKLVSKTDAYNYDHLIIAAGSRPDFHNVPGVEDNALTLGSYEDALRIREHISDSFLKASNEKDADKRKALLTFVIGGAGFTGVETAGEIAKWTLDLCREYKISKKEVRLVIVEAKANILDRLSNGNIKKAYRYITKRLRAEVRTSAEIVSADAGSVTLKSGEKISANTVIWTAGVKVADIIENTDINKDAAGRIKVDAFTKTQYANVYAAGSAALYNTGSYDLPDMITYAIQTGRTAAMNILSKIRGNSEKIVRPQLFGVAVSIGSFYAVGKFCGIRVSSFWAVIVKYLNNIRFLFRFGGFELASKYLVEEFTNKKQSKFLIEDHYSYKSVNFWLVPIRLFLGYSWFMEGYNKIGEGWLGKAMFAGLPSADAASSASVSETGETVFRIVAAHTPGWYAWIANTLIIPNALVFQWMIVITEMALGIALVTGTFTFICGVVALGLNINFLLSTGLLPETYWFIPAAIVVMGGAGRAFGVDHYLIPWLTRQWKYFIRNKRFHIWPRA